MTTTIGHLMSRAATGMLGALTCVALAAAHDDSPEKLGKVSTADTERPEVKRAEQFSAKS